MMKSSKKYLLLLLLPLLLTGCNKNVETFHFTGTVHGFFNCTPATSVFDIEFGYIVSLSEPDSIGADYTDAYGDTYHNCVVLYRTRDRILDGEEISGEMYLDSDYSKAYCTLHYKHSLPEAVCYGLER